MFSENVKNLVPYSPSQRVDISELKDWLLLDWNESTYPLPESVNQAIHDSLKAGDGVRYAMVDGSPVVELLAKRNNVSRDQILIFNGSDSALRDCITAIGPTKTFYSIQPEYSQIETFVQAVGAKYKFLYPENPFNLSVEFILDNVPPGSVLYLSNPNNPTGRLMSTQDISKLLKSGINLLLDEAYIEFSNGSSAELISRHDNIVIFRTFSKAFGMAGLRLGYILTSVSNCRTVGKVRNPKEINSVALAAGASLLKETACLDARIGEIILERQRLIKKFNAHKPYIEVFTSEANFVVIKSPCIKKIIQRLNEKKILVRDRSNMHGLSNCMRVTIGDPASMQRFSESFLEIIGNLRF